MPRFLSPGVDAGGRCKEVGCDVEACERELDCKIYRGEPRARSVGRRPHAALRAGPVSYKKSSFARPDIGVFFLHAGYAAGARRASPRRPCADWPLTCGADVKRAWPKLEEQGLDDDAAWAAYESWYRGADWKKVRDAVPSAHAPRIASNPPAFLLPPPKKRHVFNTKQRSSQV